ncbi:hypothetical protein Lo5R7ANS_30 [Mesorhizobium phage vB_MloP_Lo5R7ANS]|uniref:Uncharacterized protein n=1 Tax=Mesorhizobium phage vB_MloP_Lo5R7ANS TaxID=1527771 RepID=A0A076YM60_9CAUD|nr:hypothetical protein Lo5R7ANS_30 [Mesorhizobium phage vB_MloP_Lo5R7ANS]AIK68500.1 hypothetical protein Lo5R7ANS_30 [Mesorhizobium phage vB_MloP_Lo5R7ANS]
MKRLTDADRLSLLRYQLVLSVGRQLGKSLLTTEMVKHQLQQFQNTPPQG